MVSPSSCSLVLPLATLVAVSAVLLALQAEPAGAARLKGLFANGAKFGKRGPYDSLR